MDKEGFEDYLYGRGLYRTTVATYLRRLQHFADWCADNGTDFKNPSKDELYGYKRSAPKLGRGSHCERFTVLRHWYRFVGARVDVPFVKRNDKGKIAHEGLLEEEALLELYRAVPAATLVGRRNKAVVSLIVFQALTRKTISLLEPRHLDLETGNVHVPATLVTNERILPLHPAQVPALSDYLYRCREALLAGDGIAQSPYLFAMPGGTGSFRSSITTQLPKLRRHFPRLRGWDQVRRSRIMVWVRARPLRRAQYMAGIRHVSSMRSYAQGDIAELKNLIERYHPL